jgi:hypothetical protein
MPLALLAVATGLGLVIVETTDSILWALGLGITTLAVVLGEAKLERWPRVQIALVYAYALAFYTAIEWLVPALGRSAMDAELLAIDRALLGETPAAILTPTPWLTDVMSGFYGSYHLYLHGSLIWAIVRIRTAPALTEPLFLAFALGMAGYLLVPATGPAIASPELFSQPLNGGWLFEGNRAFIAQGTSLYDVFPSLHVLVTLVLLDHDWHHLRRRFWVAIGPALVLMTSTVYLRYHYVIDCLAAVLVWGVVRMIMRRTRPPVSKTAAR